jgi:sugar O-acyltransferase (sialic acid O-acetyltransferase NeuD family)
MSIDVVVVGAGGHGTEVASYVRQLQAAGEPVNLLGFIDDSRADSPLKGVAMLGNVERLLEVAAGRKNELRYISALGSNAARKALVERVESVALAKLRPWTLRHPAASAGNDAVELGEGSLLAPGAIVTARVHIGRHCILNVKASVSHDCVVGDFCNLNPGCTVLGSVTLGEGCFVGAGAVIREGVSVGAWTVIGAGAVVLRDLPGRVTAVGVPARIKG